MTEKVASLLTKWAEDRHPTGLVVSVGAGEQALRALATGAVQAGRHVVAFHSAEACGDGFWNQIVFAPSGNLEWPGRDMISLLYVDQEKPERLHEELEKFLPYLAPGGSVIIQDYFARRNLEKTVWHFFPRLNLEPAQAAGDTLAIQPVSPIAGSESPVHLTVVMAAANRDLRLPLECLRDSHYPASLILVDGGGNILPRHWESGWYRIEADPGQPFHEARLKNVGLIATVTSHILFLNADICLPPGQTEWLRAQLREKPHVMFTVPLLDVSEAETDLWRERNEADWEYPGDEFGVRSGAYGDFIACEAGLLKLMGGWDEDFIGAGVLDDHLVNRWMRAGRLVVSAPPCYHLWHPGRKMYFDEWQIYRDRFNPVRPVVNKEVEWGMAFPREERRAQIAQRAEELEQARRDLHPQPLQAEEWKEWGHV